MAGKLANLKVLLTRQAHTVDSLAAQIESLGGQTQNLPLFAIEAVLDQPAILKLQDDFKQSDLVICISRNAAEIAVPHLYKSAAVQWAAVGPSTAQYLQKMGISDVLCPANTPYDSHALLQVLQLRNINLENKYIMLLTGADGGDWLGSALRALKARVNVAAVYRRTMPAISLDQVREVFSVKPAIDIILITCVTSLVNLIQLATAAEIEVYDLPLLVVSQRIYKFAVEQGFTKVYTAAGMSDAAIISALASI